MKSLGFAQKSVPKEMIVSTHTKYICTTPKLSAYVDKNVTMTWSAIAHFVVLKGG